MATLHIHELLVVDAIDWCADLSITGMGSLSLGKNMCIYNIIVMDYIVSRLYTKWK